MADKAKSTTETESPKSDESANVHEDVLEFIKEWDYDGVNDYRFDSTEAIYDYLTSEHNLNNDEVLEFMIEKLNTALGRRF